MAAVSPGAASMAAVEADVVNRVLLLILAGRENAPLFFMLKILGLLPVQFRYA